MDKKFIRSFMIYGLSSGISKSLMIFLLPIYTRIFSPEEYGIIDLIHTVVAFLSILGMLQLQTSVARHFYESPDTGTRRKYISTTFWTIIFFSVVLTIVTGMLASSFSNVMLDDPKYGMVIFIASFIIPASNMFNFLVVIVRYLERPVTYGLLITAQLLTTIAISVWLVVFERIGIMGVFYGELVGFTFGGILVFFVLRDYITFTWKKEVLRSFLTYSLPLLPAHLGTWINSYANRFVMLGYLSLADIGIYTVALKIASVFRLMEQAFKLTLGPYIWKKLEHPQHREIYRSIMRTVSVIVFSLIGIYALFSNEVVMLLSTSEYADASPLVGLICLSIGINMLYPVVSVGINIVKKTIYNSLALLISVGVNVGVLFLLVPSIGLIGVPIALVCGALAMSGTAWFFTERLYPIAYQKLYAIVPLVGIGSLVSMLALTEPDLLTRIVGGISIAAICALWVRANLDSFRTIA